MSRCQTSHCKLDVYNILVTNIIIRCKWIYVQIVLIFHHVFFHIHEECPNCFNPFKPEFTIVIFIHYKPRIAVAILDL